MDEANLKILSAIMGRFVSDGAQKCTRDKNEWDLLRHVLKTVRMMEGDLRPSDQELLDELVEPVELAAAVGLLALWPVCGAAFDGLIP